MNCAMNWADEDGNDTDDGRRDRGGAEPGAEEEVESSSLRSPRPTYTVRQPPLVQPLCISSFTDRTLAKYGTPDLAREWVALFQTIGGGVHSHDRIKKPTGSSATMKMNIPDTIFLSPTG